MSVVIEMNDFLSTIETAVEGVEDNISSEYLYLIVYRLSKKYKLSEGVQVRGSYEDILNSSVFSDTSIDPALKQMLWNFNISFSDNTLDGVEDNHNAKRALIVLDNWVSTEDLSQRINEGLRNGEFSMTPTDLFIESLKSNKEYNDISSILDTANICRLTLWYIKSNVNYYASYEDKNHTYHAKYDESEILDLTYTLKEYFDVPSFSADIVDRLIELGQSMYDDGIKCVEFYDVIPELHYINEHNYFSYVAIYLVYIQETYGMQVNAVCDDAFCWAYANYKKSDYCLAEDLFYNRDKIYPVMLYSTRNNRCFMFIRNIKYDYTYYYVRKGDLDKMLLGDTSIKMRAWNMPTNSIFNNDSILDSKYARKSEFLDRFVGEVPSSEPEVVSLFSLFDTEEKIAEVVNLFNKYNVENSGGVVPKYITVRDVLCRKVMDGDEEVIEIGYIQSLGEDSYNNRIKEDITVSGINADNGAIPSLTYFTLSRDANRSLYNVNYVYDLASKAPNSLINFIKDMDSTADTIDDPTIVYDDDGEVVLNDDGTPKRIVSCTPQEKFLYYMYSRELPAGTYKTMYDNLTGDKLEYRVAMYKGVYTASSILPELSKNFSISNLIDAELLDIYGEINRERFITSDGKSQQFNIDNRLFGIMKVNK